MRINKPSSLIGLTMLLLLGPMSAAQATNPGLYLGVSLGAYRINEGNLNDNNNVVKAVVGSQFNEWFGVEGAWTDFNRANNGGDRFDADGRGLAAVISIPVGPKSTAFFKGGQFWWKSDSSFGGDVGAKRGSDPFFGLGFKFGFNDHIALRLEVERYDVSDTHINTVTGGIEFKF